MEINNDYNIFLKLKNKSDLIFDYEVNSAALIEDENGKIDSIRIYGKSYYNNYDEIYFRSFWDSLEISQPNNEFEIKSTKANLMKRLVSKKKKRFQNEYFDLDLSYITRRVIAMGYPSVGCESLWRNSLSDVLNFFALYHTEIKVYNLCLEKNRLYSKERFSKYSLAIFPFSDHNPCPVKLMLECCVDIVLFLLKEPEGVVAIHCKAGKGRTGIMIICYLIFSGLCRDSNEAINHYAKMRTKNCKGVTIASQIRYIKYFEAFLSSNFTEPYYLMIPQIIKYYINPKTTNIITNYMTDDSYFKSKNNFILNYLKIGPFTSPKRLMIEFSSLVQKDLGFPNKEMQIIKEDEERFFFLIKFHSIKMINFDICIKVREAGIKFYCWVNLWYSCLELISTYIFHNKLFLKTDSNDISNELYSWKNSNNKKPNFVEMKNLFYKREDKSLEEIVEEEEENNNTLHEMISKNRSELIVNKKKNILDKFSLNSKSVKRGRRIASSDRCHSILQLIDDLSNDPDLNTLISGINKKAIQRNVEILNKENLTISLGADELDKFSNSKHMVKDFSLVLNFSLKV